MGARATSGTVLLLDLELGSVFGARIISASACFRADVCLSGRLEVGSVVGARTTSESASFWSYARRCRILA